MLRLSLAAVLSLAVAGYVTAPADAFDAATTPDEDGPAAVEVAPESAAEATEATDPEPAPADDAAAPQNPMTFFLTSVGPGNGADLGGLEGADAWCEHLAYAVGAGDRTWRAYLSAAPSGGMDAVHARDRIGDGPWHNAEGVMVARNPDHLHSDDANMTKESNLTEWGEIVNGRGDSPNRHDILTGSNLDGTLYEGSPDATCSNWTSSAGDGSARVGHFDRTGGGENPTSWNSAHNSRGCGQNDLRGTGGDGLFFCFAADD